MNKTRVMMVIIAVAILIFIVYQDAKREGSKRDVNSILMNKYEQRIKELEKGCSCPIEDNESNESNNITIIEVDRTPTVISDPIKDYDRSKILDPIENPARRIERHHIPPTHVKQFLNIPTQGYPDNYRLMGVLTSTGEGESNKILRLFGRQTFPGSNKYEYYTAINSGLDNIKVPLSVDHDKELYNGDKVNVDVLDGAEYSVKLHPLDHPRYYPDVI